MVTQAEGGQEVAAPDREPSRDCERCSTDVAGLFHRQIVLPVSARTKVASVVYCVLMLKGGEGTMKGKRQTASTHVLEHLGRAEQSIADFRTDGLNPDGILIRPHFQAAALKVAREELTKAITIIERTKWGTLD